MEKIQEKITKYLEMRRQQGISENTLLAYERDLRRMAEYLERVDSKDSLMIELELQDYLRKMEQEQKRPATVARAVASIKAFFRYLYQSGEMNVNPAMQIKAPKIEKTEPYILTPEETVRLLQQPSGSSPKALRDKAMLELLYATGIRVSELVQLTMEDVNLTMDYILCSQGGRERVIPFHNMAKKSLQEYLEKARPILVTEPDCKLLFTNLSGTKMSRQGFWKLIKQYAKAAGIQEDITPHTLRHSFAAHLVNNGADLYAVQELMGYVDLSGAQVYAKMHPVSVREVYTKAHPRK